MFSKSVLFRFVLFVTTLLGGYYLLQVADLPAQKVAQQWQLADSQFLQMKTGLRVHYRDLRGENLKKKPVIVLLHGSGSSLHSWTNWAIQLAKKHPVILLDLPGAGLTGPAISPKFKYSIPDYSQFVSRFLQKLGVKKYVIGGHSVGGEIAWYMAATNPSKIQGLLLVAPTGFPVPPPLTWRIGKMPFLGWLVRDITPAWIVHQNLIAAFEQDKLVSDKLTHRYQELLLRKGNREALRRQMRSASLNFWPHLKEIKAKTLILWGKEDQWLPVSLAQKYLSQIRNGKLIVYPDAGHNLPEEISRAPQDVRDWLTSIDDNHVK